MGSLAEFPQLKAKVGINGFGRIGSVAPSLMLLLWAYP